MRVSGFVRCLQIKKSLNVIMPHLASIYSSIGLVTVMYTTIKVFVSALDRFSNLSIYSRLLDFLTILSTCRFHIKLFWTTRPKIFSDSTSLIDLSPYNRNFDLGKSRQIFHHSLKEHHKISNIPKFRCEML